MRAEISTRGRAYNYTLDRPPLPLSSQSVWAEDVIDREPEGDGPMYAQSGSGFGSGNGGDRDIDPLRGGGSNGSLQSRGPNAGASAGTGASAPELHFSDMSYPQGIPTRYTRS